MIVVFINEHVKKNKIGFCFCSLSFYCQYIVKLLNPDILLTGAILIIFSDLLLLIIIL